MIHALRSAERVLVVGIGGGGDVVGALAVVQLAGLLGTPAIAGGLTWERRPIDPIPGPRRIDELRDAQPINAHTALAGPDTTGPGNFHFAESHVARHLGEPVLLLDPSDGPAQIAAGLAGAARGDEAGLASPLADAVCLAAAPALAAAGLEPLLAVFGAGCDGELTPAEVLERVAEVARAGGHLGTWGPGRDELEHLQAAVAQVPTEASAMALACARGTTGSATIRGGRRTVQLTPAGGLVFFLDPLVALRSAAHCAALVEHVTSLQQGNAILLAHGMRTELEYETENAAAEAPPEG